MIILSPSSTPRDLTPNFPQLSKGTKEDLEGYTVERFHQKEHTFGTIALITNMEELPASRIFEYFKSRVDIEQMFDTFKNTLQADRTYMRSDYSFEGWMFINYLSLTYYYKNL